MKLSKESIEYILNLQKNKLPLVYCYSNLERLENLRKIISKNHGRICSNLKEKNSDFTSIDTLLIFMDDITKEDILYLEEKVMVLSNSMVALLEARGRKLSIHKRNLLSSFFNKSNIKIIKGSKEEIENLIKIYNNNEIHLGEKDCRFEYRYFSKRNNTILIIEENEYYITDGYSEFFIKNNSIGLENNEILKDIYTGMIAVGIGVCKNKGEVIQSILISTMAFDIINYLALKEVDNIINYDYKEIIEYLLDKIKNINSKEIQCHEKIYYNFKR